MMHKRACTENEYNGGEFTLRSVPESCTTLEQWFWAAEQSAVSETDQRENRHTGSAGWAIFATAKCCPCAAGHSCLPIHVCTSGGVLPDKPVAYAPPADRQVHRPGSVPYTRTGSAFCNGC